MKLAYESSSCSSRRGRTDARLSGSLAADKLEKTIGKTKIVPKTAKRWVLGLTCVQDFLVTLTVRILFVILVERVERRYHLNKRRNCIRSVSKLKTLPL